MYIYIYLCPVSWIMSLLPPVSADNGACREFNSISDDRETVVKMIPGRVDFSLSWNPNNSNGSSFHVFSNILLTKGMSVTGLEPETILYIYLLLSQMYLPLWPFKYIV
jgi:hypothetical protein